MNPYKKLFNNSIIFGIGNFGSKIIALILVPLYTYYLSPSEFGSADILVTTTRMLLPIISLSIFDSVFRYVMDIKYDNKDIITNSILVSLIGTVVLLISYPLLYTYNVFDGYLIYMYIILILQSFESLFSQYARAIGALKLFAFNGILMTLVLVISNIVLLIFLNYGVKGYLLSIVISNIISIIFLFYFLKIFNSFKINKVNSVLIKEMLIYSIPLIPNALLWWTMSSSNRYLILYYWGASANGLFAVAQKIPSFLSIISSIFAQSWQLSAIEEYNSEDRSVFYSKVFNNYSILLLSVVSAILVCLKVLMKNIVAPDFYLAWDVIPYLLIGSAFNSFSVFLGANYIAAKQTKGVFKTTIFGSIITIILGLTLIPLLGLKGAGISIMLSSFVMWLIRIFDTKKYITMTINIKQFSITLLIIILQVIILNIDLNIAFEFLIEFALFILLLYINKRIIKGIFNIFIKKIKNR